MPRLRLLGALAIAGLLAGGLAGCGGEDRLTIYSGRQESLIGPLLQQFSEQTSTAIDVRYGDSAELALQIEEEGENSPADVFFSQTPGAAGFLAGAGRLAVLPEDVLGEVEDRFREPEGRWVGVTGRQRVLVYNTEMVDESELPGSVLDLEDDEFAGRVAVAPTNGSFQDFVSALRETQGEERAQAFLTDLAEGGAPTYANNDAIVEAVGRGEVEMGLVNHYYAYRFLEEQPELPVANHLFEGDDVGALLIPATAGVTATADNPQAAAFVQFLLGEEAQRYFAEETKEYPLSAGVAPAEGVPALQGTPDVDVAVLGGDLTSTLELIEESGL
jgi:iron(III) transport system substrate-binding protein